MKGKSVMIQEPPEQLQGSLPWQWNSIQTWTPFLYMVFVHLYLTPLCNQVISFRSSTSTLIPTNPSFEVHSQMEKHQTMTLVKSSTCCSSSFQSWPQADLMSCCNRWTQIPTSLSELPLDVHGNPQHPTCSGLTETLQPWLPAQCI